MKLKQLSFFIPGLFSSILYAYPVTCPSLDAILNLNFDEAQFNIFINTVRIYIDDKPYGSPDLWSVTITLYDEYNPPIPDKPHAIEQFKKLFSTVSSVPVPKLVTDEWGYNLGYECDYVTSSHYSRINLFSRSF